MFFGLVCVVLLGAALVFSSNGWRSRSWQSGVGRRAAPLSCRPSAPAARVAARAQRLVAALRRTARRFLGAFLRYEVGEGGSAAAATLRATATRSFAARLLAAPPRAPAAGGFPTAARLGELEVGLLAPAANRALISASAVRAGRPEQLSFLFVRRGASWLAMGPGQ